MDMTDSIIELNRDVEPLIIQASATRTAFFRKKFPDRFRPIQFVHFSDIHARLDLWNRVVEYVNYYHDYIDFALHTGDYCGARQEEYVDFYNRGEQCVRNIYNCIGNHDTYTTTQWLKNTKESAHSLLFAPSHGIDGTFMECDHSMTYYRDFPESNLRMIVLDLYYDIDLQCEWLRKILDDAREKELCVITAMHEPSDTVNDTFGVTFHSKNEYVALNGRVRTKEFEPIIADFIAAGGCHVCNFVGDEHHDLFGLTDSGVLNSAVPCATSWDGWSDGKRIPGTRTFDCFNVVSIDPDMGLLKLVRVGNNRDLFLRSQRSLCYDFINKKVIFND